MKKLRKPPFQVYRQELKTRLICVSALLIVFGLGVSSRLFFLQVLKHEDLLAYSEKQYLSTIKTQYDRGGILDRNNNLLATNIEVESVYIRPEDVGDKSETAQRIASVLDLDAKSLFKKISTARTFAWIKRKCSVKEIETLRQQNLPGVGFAGEHKRFYPKREMASHFLGFVGLDNQGLAGVEHAYQDSLKGETRLVVMEKDAVGRQLRSVSTVSGGRGNGKDIVLTIDEVIQFIAESELKAQVEKYHAKNGIAIVMSPQTGEIYAMAVAPVFNPNNYSAYAPATWKNHAVASAYEPGSIFKPIVAAAALDTGRAALSDVIFCENGSYYINGAHIGEAAHHQYGNLSFVDVIAKSSNIGSIKIGQKVGAATYADYIQKFGFGDRLGIDLPGEARGKFRDLSQWSGLSLASLSFGQEISVTPLQMISAYAAIANGGVLMRPHITRAILKDGATVETIKPEPLRRVISENTSRQMSVVLGAVVTSGTGEKAAVEGYTVAGKTGTAQKLDPETHKYSATGYISSFVGYVPVENPKLVILVMVDEPHGGQYGGVVAAPVFREIAKKTLRYLNVPSNQERVLIMDRA